MLYSINLVTTQCSCVNQKVKISTDNCSYPEVSFCKHSYYGIFILKSYANRDYRVCMHGCFHWNITCVWLSDYWFGGEVDNLHVVSSVSSSICPQSSQCFEVQVCETNVIERPSPTAISNWGLLLENLSLETLIAFMQFWRKFIQIHVYSSFHKLAECVHSRFELNHQNEFIQAFHVSSM